MKDVSAPLVDRSWDARPLVSVIIPAYNAAETISATLDSVRSQSYSHIEIIVVDDGSSDSTSAVVSAHAARDRRIMLIQQANAGVAAARNRGIDVASGPLIAPIDADDLWARTNIERQVETFLQSGPGTTIVYSWHARIDEVGRILAYSRQPLPLGGELKAMCWRNLVGHGSGAIMCRESVLSVGGYDVSLRARGAQGAEDHKLYLELALHGRIALAPEVLVGYRVTRANMSSDVVQMCRSAFLVLEEFRTRYPTLRQDLAVGRRISAKWYMTQALQKGKLVQASRLLGALAATDAPGAALVLLETPFRLVRRFARKVTYALSLILFRPAVKAEPVVFPAGSTEVCEQCVL